MADKGAVAGDVRVELMERWAKAAREANERLLTELDPVERERLIRERSYAEFEYMLAKQATDWREEWERKVQRDMDRIDPWRSSRAVRIRTST